VAQQSLIMRKHGAKIELWDNIKELFGKKKDRTSS
jgi:YidC/Oxa1 family membrane protein insertase